jgi:hypothetical protein
MQSLVRWCGLVGIVAAAVLGRAAPAHAVELRLGAKAVLTLSGMIGVEASDVTLAPWDESSAGVGFGGGIYADLHFNKLIALELDVLFEGNRLFFQTTQGEVLLEQAVVYEQLRVPLLFKLVAHVSDHVEFTGALGPEILIGVGATPHSALYDPRADDFNSFYTAATDTGFALTAAFGFGFLTKYLHIPIELRFAYNLLGAYSYNDRVERFGKDVYALQAAENFQASLVVGFGFRIPPEQPPPPPRPVAQQVVEVDDPFYYPPQQDD